MLKFYDIAEDYVKYLQTIDRQIPNIHYNTNNKFVCGIVFEIKGVKYYAPISHTVKKFQTSMLIYDKGTPISSIRFSFMLPAYDEVLIEKNFKQIAKEDQNYANDIYKKAEAVYRIGCNKNHQLNYTCCNFKKLEEEYLKYKLK